MKLRIMFGVVLVAAALLLLAGSPLLSDVIAADDPPVALQAVAAELPIVDDFEAGLPATWFQYGDTGTSIVQTIELTTTRPGASSTSVLKLDYVSTGWGAGTGRDIPGEDWSWSDGMGFWFHGTGSGYTYNLILSDNGATAGDSASAERMLATFEDTTAGWRFVTLPWDSFIHNPAYQPPGAPDDGVTLTEVWAYAFDFPAGNADTIYVDDVRLWTFTTIHDFEAGLPTTWFQYGDYDNGASIATTVEMTTTRPGESSTSVLKLDYVSAGWGAGTGSDIPAEDWSWSDGLGFWFYGTGSDYAYNLILSDNKSDPSADTAERFVAVFTDTIPGWSYVTLPWDIFVRSTTYQPPGAPDDGLTLTEVWAYAFDFPAGNADTVYVDDVVLLDGIIAPAVTFESDAYSVEEAGTATITATLNMTLTYPVTVTYATSDGTATAASDYTAATGQLVFPADTLTQSFTVTTLDDTEQEGAETIDLTLSNPVSITLGAQDAAVLTILDNDQVVGSPCGEIFTLVDGFETGLPYGLDGDGLEIGFVTWGDFWNGTTVTITAALQGDADPMALPDQQGDNTLLKVDLNVVGWGGVTHAFENDTVDTWVTQDWSSYDAVAFWIYGQNTGNTLLFEIQDNRNPGSTVNDVETWSYEFTDDFNGWQYMAIPFTDFVRKEIGNGAPDDGFGLTEVHGWSFGSLPTASLTTYYLDNVSVIKGISVIDDFEDGLPYGLDGDGIDIGFFIWGDDWNGTAVTITTTSAGGGSALALPCQTGPNQLLQMDAEVVGWGGLTHNFENDTVDTWISQDWSAYEGVTFWFYGEATGYDVFFEIQENRNPDSTTADAEVWSYAFVDDATGWQRITIPFTDFYRKDIGNGAPNDGLTLTEVHGWAFGSLTTTGTKTYYLDDVALYGKSNIVVPLQVAFDLTEYPVLEGETATISVSLNMTATHPVTVSYAIQESAATPDRDYTPVSGELVFPPDTETQTFTLTTLDDDKAEGDERLTFVLSDPVDAELGFVKRAVILIQDDDTADPMLLDDFEGYHLFDATGLITTSIVEIAPLSAMDATVSLPPLPYQTNYEQVLDVAFDTTGGDAALLRTFSEEQDWSAADGLRFWYYGSGSGETVTVTLLDNATATTADVDPGEWVLAWSDEFNDPAGTPPDPNVWTAEVGDGILNGNLGWGNSELEYYTDDPANASTDGNGNLVITASEINTETTELVCYYGACEYSSARLISANKMEFEYGRIEARLKIPYGQGIWPAWWMLGNDIGEVGWPQSGEIDIMENIGREPDIVHGTIHGPGYSGGAGIGGSYTLDSGNLSDEFHTYAVEWSPDQIRWFIDDTNFFTATAEMVAPNEWVYDHPFFLILNVAVGGNWPGYPDETTTFPQTMDIDYVRVYQAADTAERFEATFVDNTAGWNWVVIPFWKFTRSADQPVDAPDDGLTLTDVWGYGFQMPENTTSSFALDRVQLYTFDTIHYLPWVLVQP